MASHMSSSGPQTRRMDVRGRGLTHVDGGCADLDALMEAQADRHREQAERDLDQWEDLDAWMGYGDGYD